MRKLIKSRLLSHHNAFLPLGVAAVLLTCTSVSAVTVLEESVPGMDYSNDSMVPTDLTAQVSNLESGDQVFGAVGVLVEDVLDEFSFSLQAAGDTSIRFQITDYLGPADDSAFVVVGDKNGILLQQLFLNSNQTGTLTFTADTGGNFEPFVIRFDPPTGGSYSFAVGIPEPQVAVLLLWGLCVGALLKLLTRGRVKTSDPLP